MLLIERLTLYVKLDEKIYMNIENLISYRFLISLPLKRQDYTDLTASEKHLYPTTVGNSQDFARVRESKDLLFSRIYLAAHVVDRNVSFLHELLVSERSTRERHSDAASDVCIMHGQT